MKVLDKLFSGKFGDREIHFGDLISRQDLEIYTEAVMFDLFKKHPTTEHDEMVDIYCRHDVEEIAWDIFHDMIINLLPYHVKLYPSRKLLKWCVEHTHGKLRIVKSGIFFEREDDATLCKMKMKRYEIYKAKTYVVRPPGKRGIEEWLNENIGERYFTWYWPTTNTIHFYDEEDAIHFKMVW